MQTHYSAPSGDEITTVSQGAHTMTFVNGVIQDTGFIAQEVASLDPSLVANISAAAGSMGNVTIGTGSTYYYNTGAGAMGSSGTISISGGGYSIGTGSTITLNDINPSAFEWKNEEFVDCFPNFDRIKKMCEQYPGLQIAYEKFVTTYKLVKDHYDTPESERPIP